MLKNLDAFKALQKSAWLKYIADVEIEKLNLSVRMYNTLKRAHINTVADFAVAQAEDIVGLQGISNQDYQSLTEGLKRIFSETDLVKAATQLMDEKGSAVKEMTAPGAEKTSHDDFIPSHNYFYWTYANLKMVEAEFGQKIKECHSFHPTEKTGLCHGMFTLENGLSFYVCEGMLGFHIFRTKEPVIESQTIFIEKEDGPVVLIDKRTAEPIKMLRVMGLPLDMFSDCIPLLVHQDDEQPGHDHYIVVGHDPEDKRDMVCVQEYHDGFRTVWMSGKTFDNPIVIDDNRYSLSMPEEINDLLDYVESSAVHVLKAVLEHPDEIPDGLYDASVNFAYAGKYYQINVDALDEYSPQMFFYIEGILSRLLIEMGAVFIMGNADIR